MMKSLLVMCAVALGAGLAVASPARADSINPLSGWDGGTALDGVGETWGGALWVARSLGQTFKVDSEARLNSMTFTVKDNEAQTSKLDVVVMEWDGSAPKGSVLYRTGPVTPTADRNWTSISVSLGNTVVHPDKDYVAIVTTSPYMDSVQNNAMAAFAWDNYSGGSCWFHTAFGPNEELTGSWTNIGVIDLGVSIDYTPVPEPATLAMLALGGAAVIRRRR
jgi:hypothetical protein